MVMQPSAASPTLAVQRGDALSVERGASPSQQEDDAFNAMFINVD